MDEFIFWKMKASDLIASAAFIAATFALWYSRRQTIIQRLTLDHARRDVEPWLDVKVDRIDEQTERLTIEVHNPSTDLLTQLVVRILQKRGWRLWIDDFARSVARRMGIVTVEIGPHGFIQPGATTQPQYIQTRAGGEMAVQPGETRHAEFLISNPHGSLPGQIKLRISLLRQGNRRRMWTTEWNLRIGSR